MSTATPRTRPDWLRETHAVLVLTAAAVSVGIVIQTCRGIFGPLTLRTASDHVVDPGTAATNLTGGTAIDPSGSIDLIVKDPSTGQSLLHALTWLPTATILLVTIAFLLRVVGTARRRPFTATTSQRLRRLGFSLVIGGPIAVGVEFLARFVLSDTATTRGAAGNLELGSLVVWAIAGVGCFAIAQVVQLGTAISTELDEVI